MNRLEQRCKGVQKVLEDYMFDIENNSTIKIESIL